MQKIILAIVSLLYISLGYSQQDRILKIPNGQLYYQTFGEGSPLVIINGGPGMNSKGFIPLAKELSKNNQTIIYDQRGTGSSTLEKMDASTLTMDLMVEDLELLRKHLGFQKWTVMGHSFGGILAYYYATKHPERIVAMIQSSSGGMDLALLTSLDITGSLTRAEQDSLNYYSRKIADGDTSYKTAFKRGTFLAPAYVYNRAHVPAVAERLTQGNSSINSLIWQDLRRIGYDTKTQLKEFEKPVLIIHGREDVVGLEIPQTAHKILPESKLVIMDKTRHYGWLDSPEIYYNTIEEFLGSLE